MSSRRAIVGSSASGGVDSRAEEVAGADESFGHVGAGERSAVRRRPRDHRRGRRRGGRRRSAGRPSCRSRRGAGRSRRCRRVRSVVASGNSTTKEVALVGHQARRVARRAGASAVRSHGTVSTPRDPPVIAPGARRRPSSSSKTAVISGLSKASSPVDPASIVVGAEPAQDVVLDPVGADPSGGCAGLHGQAPRGGPVVPRADGLGQVGELVEGCRARRVRAR